MSKFTYHLLYTEYIINKLDSVKIAEKYFVSTKTVFRALKKFDIDKSQRYPQELSKGQKDIIIASTLGVGAFFIDRNSTNAEFRCEHTIFEKEYASWKYRVLKPWCLSGLKERKHLASKVVNFRLGSHPKLTELYNQYFLNGELNLHRVLADIDDARLAIWYMDKGSYYYSPSSNQTFLKLSTYNFPHLDQIIIKNWLKDKYGLTFHINRDNEYYYLRAATESIDDFIEIVSPYIHSSMYLNKIALRESDVGQIQKKEEDLKPQFDNRFGIFIDKRNRERLIKYPEKFNQNQLSLLYGSLLGDAGVFKGNGMAFAHFQEKHSIDQKEYIFHKFDVLKDFINYDEPKCNLRTGPSSGYAGGKDFYTLYTTSHPLFDELREKFYIGKTKRVTPEILSHIDPLALAYWYQDDGYVTFNKSTGSFSALFCTDSFTYKEHELIIGWFMERYGLKATIRNQGYGKIRICFSANPARQLFKLIEPFIVATLKYKIATSRITDLC